MYLMLLYLLAEIEDPSGEDSSESEEGDGGFWLEGDDLPVVAIGKNGTVLLLRHDAVARILANGSAAFFESCAAIG